MERPASGRSCGLRTGIPTQKTFICHQGITENSGRMNVRVKKYQQIIGIKTAKKVKCFEALTKKKTTTLKRDTVFSAKTLCYKKQKIGVSGVLVLPSGRLSNLVRLRKQKRIPEGLAASPYNSPIGSPRPRNPSKIEVGTESQRTPKRRLRSSY